MSRGSDRFFEILEDLWLVIIILIVGVVLFFWLGFTLPSDGILGRGLYFALILSPVFLVLVLAPMFWELWLGYIRYLTVANIKPVLLEILLPQEVLKSPLAMEVFFGQMYISGASTILEQYWLGKLRPWFSFELVSLGGAVHLYIWTDSKNRGVVESQLYAQYPNVVIQEAEDYATKVNWNPALWTMWGTHFILSEKDVYPIKTYVDYGLDKTGAEEEEKTDPMTAVLEYLGALKPGEQAWIQILIQAHKKEGLAEGRLIKKEDWKADARKEIEKIRKEATPKTEGDYPGFPNPTKGQTEKIAALERSINKYPFETMIRAFYLATPETFSPPNIPALIGTVRQYSSRDLNGFKLGWFTDHKDTGKDLNLVFGWIPPFGRYMKNRRAKMEQTMLDAYKKRSIFNPPYTHFKNKPFILNTEELATIFHIPGRVAATPTLQKIESKRGQAPTNLPL